MFLGVLLKEGRDFHLLFEKLLENKPDRNMYFYSPNLWLIGKVGFPQLLGNRNHDWKCRRLADEYKIKCSKKPIP